MLNKKIKNNNNIIITIHIFFIIIFQQSTMIIQIFSHEIKSEKLKRMKKIK